MAENFLNVRGWGATLTIKSASGREVKGKEALRGKKGFHLQGFGCVGLWVGGNERCKKKAGEEGVVVCYKTSHCLSQGQVLALFLMNSFILFCWLYLHQQQKTVSWSVSLASGFVEHLGLSGGITSVYLTLTIDQMQNLRPSSTGKGIANLHFPLKQCWSQVTD